MWFNFYMDTSAAAIIENLNTVTVNGRSFTYGTYAEAIAQRNTWIEQAFARGTETTKQTVAWGGFVWTFAKFASGGSDTVEVDTRIAGIRNTRLLNRAEVQELIGA